MTDTARKRILIIEDDNMLRNILSNQLGRNFEITQADNGEKGLTGIKEFRPDLVLLDLLLPGLSGFDVLEKVRQDPEIAKTKIVVFSNLSTPEDIARITTLGVTEYFVKSDTSIDAIVEKIIELTQK